MNVAASAAEESYFAFGRVHSPMAGSSFPSSFEADYDFMDCSDLNEADENGNSPLILAVCQGDEKLARSLIDQGACLNQQNNQGETALYWASSLGRDELVELLLENGANPNICDIDGASPLHVASANGNLNAMKTLASNGAFVNARDEELDSALHYAVRENKPRAVALLVRDFKARTDAKNEDQETPLELALCLQYNEPEYAEIVQILSANLRSMTKDISYPESLKLFGGASFSVQAQAQTIC